MATTNSNRASTSSARRHETNKHKRPAQGPGPIHAMLQAFLPPCHGIEYALLDTPQARIKKPPAIYYIRPRLCNFTPNRPK
jgi:hypothetical protein